MASKRMFNKQIMLSDDFMDMSAEARALYVTLNMCADDDGLVNNPKSLMRMSGASEENLEEIIENGFIHIFESGVAVILHWKVHNTIKNDRYTPSYLEEKECLLTNEKKVYEIHCEIPDPQGSIEKISKDKLSKEEGEERKNLSDKIKEKESAPGETAPVGEETDMNDCVSDKKGYGRYRNVFLTDEELIAWKDECQNWRRYIDLMSNYLESSGKSYENCLAALRSWRMRDENRAEKSCSVTAPATASQTPSDTRSYSLSRVAYDDINKPLEYRRNQ